LLQPAIDRHESSGEDVSMALTIGRNATCHCGSGKKYKKCCLPADEAKLVALRQAVAAANRPVVVIEDDGLDELSNSVLDLVRDGHLEQALAASKRLLDEFPDVVDGLERSGMVHAKMGDHATAAAFYRQAFDFVTHPNRREHYDGADYYREQMEQEERLAGLR
jgi:tetratricopeptide (TPR) repeat protein